MLRHCGGAEAAGRTYRSLQLARRALLVLQGDILVHRVDWRAAAAPCAALAKKPAVPLLLVARLYSWQAAVTPCLPGAASVLLPWSSTVELYTRPRHKHQPPSLRQRGVLSVVGHLPGRRGERRPFSPPPPWIGNIGRAPPTPRALMHGARACASRPAALPPRVKAHTRRRYHPKGPLAGACFCAHAPPPDLPSWIACARHRLDG